MCCIVTHALYKGGLMHVKNINPDLGRNFLIFLHFLHFNSLPNDKILDVTNLKAFADDKLEVAKTTIFSFDKIENNVGEGENAGYQHLRKCTVFTGAFFFRGVKSLNCVVKS